MQNFFAHNNVRWPLCVKRNDARAVKPVQGHTTFDAAPPLIAMCAKVALRIIFDTIVKVRNNALFDMMVLASEDPSFVCAIVCKKITFVYATRWDYVCVMIWFALVPQSRRSSRFVFAYIQMPQTVFDIQWNMCTGDVCWWWSEFKTCWWDDHNCTREVSGKGDGSLSIVVWMTNA